MAKQAKSAFNPKAFLATVNHGRTMSVHPKDTVVYQQAGLADAVLCPERPDQDHSRVPTGKGGAFIAVLRSNEIFGQFITSLLHLQRCLVASSSTRPSHEFCVLEKVPGPPREPRAANPEAMALHESGVLAALAQQPARLTTHANPVG